MDLLREKLTQLIRRQQISKYIEAHKRRYLECRPEMLHLLTMDIEAVEEFIKYPAMFNIETIEKELTVIRFEYMYKLQDELLMQDSDCSQEPINYNFK